MSFESSRPAFISTDVIEGKYLFLDLHPSGAPGLKLVGAGREVCSPSYGIDRAGFDYYTIEFVVGGRWKLEHEGIERSLRPGALFAYGPGTAYSLRPEQGSGLIKYFVNLTGDVAKARIRSCGLAECEVLQAREPRWIHELWDQLIECDRLDPGKAQQMGDQIVELMFLRIDSDVWREDRSRTGGLETFARCKAFMHDHYLEVHTVAQVAARCHLDPAYLARLFKRYSAERPLQLLTRLKTQHAADLMVRRGHSVKAAAEAVGFPDPYHFSRAFKRVHGVSPGRIRRR
ncbi:AraC-like DNA-binding protein [Haloferula luteola]|uniref:AraC-like DNA-binding protein n=1 Tax=Haloferula luteola TaxID=595692 RepID=A0A840V7K1_9BACT|nr:AraC family transcriptional regulator [Haloferula luteola]MBB5349930.1 AraC-like DNA-binding protein [Haloferula luteola]